MKKKDQQCKNPLDPTCMSSLKHWGKPPGDDFQNDIKKEVFVNCGWGRLIFGQTFNNPARLAEMICREKKGRRDIAMYMRDPHVVLSYAPQELFLDPSLTYRLDFLNYRGGDMALHDLIIRPLQTGDDEMAISKIYQSWGMVPSPSGFYEKALQDDALHVLVAAEKQSGDIVGVVTCVDHFVAFNDPDNGSSLWALAVDQQCKLVKVGEALVRELILLFIENGRRFLDLSVMHTNKEAIALYDKLGFEQVPVYCIKKKNPINEPLFIGPNPEEHLNIYAKIITDEARKRGIGMEILDAENGYFQLCLGGRSIVCRESLSELTTAIAMSRCDDKTVTRKILQQAGLHVPAQETAVSPEKTAEFLSRYKRIVVKPARGEQGAGISVDLADLNEVTEAVAKAETFCEKVILEEYVAGQDLRIIVIDNEVVAAAVRKPARIRGNGKLSIAELIAKQSRRRAAATGGESIIPIDDETSRTLKTAGYSKDDILPEGKEINVRKTANLHTGGTIHDVTEQLHPQLARAAITGARALNIPLVGFDFLVKDFKEPDYVVIEANERPGLANHEPQPTAEKFIDLLFPQTKHLED
ncbi:MAG: N-acetylglutaminylglutamine synthetase [Desulfopila sp.]|jgi:GNAT-family acetyltransferase (TIGR03103 family)|nr:N-acetylglutaminylglutamine synthetase [Desulfopila sp.]